MKDPFLRTACAQVDREQLRNPMLVVTLVAIALVSVGVAYCAQAAEAEVEVDCHDYASFAATMSVYRWIGADLSRVVQLLRKTNLSQDPARLKVYEAEARRIWRAQPSQDDAEASAFKRCTDLLGRFPRAKES
jgi:hypothetical protein